MGSIFDGFYSLGANINKARGKDTSEETTVGVSGEFLPELTLMIPDGDLIKLIEKWDKKWSESSVRANWIKQVEDNENYWRGKQYNKLETEQLRPLVDNIVWQAVETYLPAANKTQPEPLVEVRATEKQTEDNLKYAELIRNRLADWTTDVYLPQKLEKAGRNWLLSLLGVAKMGWNIDENMPSCKIIRPRKVILDPDAVTDEEGYNGKYIGEYRKLEASVIINLIEKERPNDAAYIKSLVKNELGTDVQFQEWWTDEYVCWICNKNVLLKKKNINWNWSAEVPQQIEPTAIMQGEEGQTASETDGIPTPVEERADSPAVQDATSTGSGQGSTPQNMPDGMPAVPQMPQSPQMSAMPAPTGPNHFVKPKKPYVFLSIFNLGKTPVDETSIVTQILPQQDLINKREKQLDKYADGLNGGVVVSEERSGLSKEEARDVTDALRRGGTVIVPSGSPQDAVYRLPSNPLPPDVYNNLIDNRSRVYDLFGIKGITPAGIGNETTVRGKIITKGLDTDRIGGGITPYFEIFASEILNWVVQLMYVYDDIFSANPGAKPPRLKITIKPGSLIPKDATTKANQAIDLANAGKMSLVDLYKALEYSDPEKMAMNVWLEANAPEILFKDDPRFQEAMALIQQRIQAAASAAGKDGAKGPSESINFKDLPPDGKTQMAAQAGIRLDAEAVAAHEVASSPTPAVPGDGRTLLSKVPTQ